jgi:hypothetical protein
VLSKAAHNSALPIATKREPKDLLTAKAGLCCDRSRAIEKILRYVGFETDLKPGISPFTQQKKTGSFLKSLTTPGVASHPVTEVLTQKGWLVVDSNYRWVSLDSNNKPVTISQIQLIAAGSNNISWNQEPPNKKYIHPFTYIYGLYSRHGKFFPPYNFIPDVNYQELAQNFL